MCGRSSFAARIEFLRRGVTKSGVNLHAEFKYFELEDIVPVATEIFSNFNCVFSRASPDGKAVGRFINLDNPDEQVVVEFTARSIAEPGKFRMNEVQGLGAEITYMRRYLYFLILDVVEADAFDAESGKDAPARKQSRRSLFLPRSVRKSNRVSPPRKPTPMSCKSKL